MTEDPSRRAPSPARHGAVSEARAASGSPALAFACVLALALAAASLNACDLGNAGAKGDARRDTVSNPAIDSLSFWPSTLRYAREGDTLYIRMTGLRLGRTCGELSELRWNWRDTPGKDFYTLVSEVVIPGGPNCERGGTFDSTFRVIFYSPAGERLYIRRGDTLKTDSVLFVSGFLHIEDFARHDSDPDSAVIERGAYRFTFLDSTAARPTRRLTAVLPVCETFQTALFRRDGDSIRVRLRRLVARPLPESVFPPCAGEHADAIEVVRDLYGTF